MRRNDGGFTIMEILIAIVILVVGITGIVALFPTAIQSGNKTVEDSYAAAITQSVVDAITVGLRESRYTYKSSDDDVWTFFIFDHDGVMDDVVDQPSTFSNNQSGGVLRDYCIVLPKAVDDDNMELDDELTFVYPTPADRSKTTTVLDNGPAANDDDMPAASFCMGFDKEEHYLVRRVYHLGRVKGDPDKVRDEFLGEAVDPNATDPERPVVDPYPQYSFAFAITRAKVDSSGDGKIDNDVNGDGQISAGELVDKYSDHLFEVRVMIFRNFEESYVPAGAAGPDYRIPRCNVPIREFVTLIST